MDRSLYYSDQQVTMISAITGRISARTNPVPVVMVTHEGCLTVECGPYLVTGQAVFVTAGLPYILHGQGCVRHTIWMDRYPCRLPVGTPPVFALSLRALNAFADFYSQRTADPVDELAEAVGLRRPVLTPEIAAITERIDADSARRLSQLQASRLVDMERTVLLKRFRRETGMTFRSYKNWAGVKSASELILEGVSISAAARESGFSDLSHFSRHCRDIFGMSPRQGKSYVLKAAEPTSDQPPPPAPARR